MKKTLIWGLIAVVGVQLAFSQERSRKRTSNEIRSLRQESLKEMLELKRQVAPNAVLPADESNDLDSFGKNVLFLGSAYAGTVYYVPDCDPAVFPSEAGVSLAADDECYEFLPGLNQHTTYNDAWKITIPGKTVNNVIYPIIGNSIVYNNAGSTGFGELVYSPRVKIESEAFNDPLAVVNGNQLNGVYTTYMPGSNVKDLHFMGHERSSENYASVNGRGFSRAYFRSIGLPESVINKLFKGPITLKFGIFTGAQTVYDFAAFSFTVRIMGQ